MLNSDQILKNKTQFIKIARENIHRDGIDVLLDRLQNTDFFIAPCSTKYHLNYRGGLCEHSLNVYDALIKLCCAFDVDINKNIEALTIVSLFHDYCKADFYKPVMKYVKKGSQWVTEPGYEISDGMPIGHGEKSLYLISRCMDLTDEEACAIRWHMGAYDSAFKGGEPAYNTACEMFPLVSLLQAADNLSARLLEKK